MGFNNSKAKPLKVVWKVKLPQQRNGKSDPGSILWFHHWHRCFRIWLVSHIRLRLFCRPGAIDHGYAPVKDKHRHWIPFFRFCNSSKFNFFKFSNGKTECCFVWRRQNTELLSERTERQQARGWASSARTTIEVAYHLSWEDWKTLGWSRRGHGETPLGNGSPAEFFKSPV